MRSPPPLAVHSPIITRRTSRFIIAACFAIAVFCLVYPIYVIRPFRHQGPGELAAALAILRYRPIVLALCLAISLITTLRYLRRLGAALAVVAICLFAALSRINIYERMFHPIGRPAFAPAAESKLDSREMVLAVHLADAARAYPVRAISYHHIVNDLVGTVPIVATY